MNEKDEFYAGLAHDVKVSYDRLTDMEKDLFDATTDYAQAKRKREAAEAKYLNDGRVVGKNKEQRDAMLAKLVSSEVQKEYEAEQELAEVKLDHRLAQLQVEYIRLITRIMEVRGTP